MTLQERAEQIVLAWYRPWDELYNLRIEDMVAHAMTVARREALQEAIQLAPKLSTVEEAGGLYTYFAGYIDCHKDYREAIRALIDQEPQP